MTVSSNRKHREDSHSLSVIPSRSTAGNHKLQHNQHHHSASGGNNSANLLNSPEYTEAIHTLNDVTMKQACELLLLNNEDDHGEASATKLLEFYHKSRKAYQVIETHQDKHQQQQLLQQQQHAQSLSRNPTSVNNGGGSGTKALSHRLGSGHGLLNKKMISSKKQGVIPMRGRKGPIPLRRERKDSIGGEKVNEPPSKKARSKYSNNEVSAPPSSALSFLAKLNKGGVDKNRSGSSRKGST